MNRLLIAAIAASGLLTTAAANAQTVLPTETGIFGGTTDLTNQPQTLDLFDSSLGTLQSVTIGGSYGFNSILTVENTGNSSPSLGSAQTESAAGFSSSNSAINTIIQAALDSLGPTLIGGSTLDAAAFDLTGGRDGYNVPVGGTATPASDATTQSKAPVVDTNPSDLSAFEAVGGGTFNVLFNTLTGTNVSNTSGNTTVTQDTTAAGSVSITYTYGPEVTPPVNTPEPATMALLGSGLLGLGLIRRRRA